MSGGSMNYVFGNLKSEAYNIPDKDIRELTEDLADLLHDLEWYLSGDYSEGDYNKTLDAFREKWLFADSNERIKKFVEDACYENKKALMGLIGCKFYCKDCEHFTKKIDDSDFGCCDTKTSCLYHGWNSACEKFEVRE